MAATEVYLLFDERMMLHRPLQWPELVAGCLPLSVEQIPEGYIFENPERIRSIHQRLLEREKILLSSSSVIHSSPDGDHCKKPSNTSRFHPLSCSVASKDTILLAHAETLYEKLARTRTLTTEELETLSREDEDIYYCHHTFLAATLSCGGVVKCVDAVTDAPTAGGDEMTRAIAIVRPPGHHACQEQAMGFCFFNSVAVAAKHPLATGRAKRVLILDWDIHHGNGIQDLTYDDHNILYVSLHRFSPRGEYFFPGTGKADEVGHGEGLGTNVNIAWTSSVGNSEYAAAFCEVILPIMASYQPELVIVSCGFDAAKGDLLGDCELTPDMFYSLTRSILETAGHNVPLVVALEGGYNIDVIATCMEAVAMALLDETWGGDDAETNGVQAASENEFPLNMESPVNTDDSFPHEKSSIAVITPSPPNHLKQEKRLKKEDPTHTRLKNGRLELSRYWNYEKEEAFERGSIKKSAATSINKTIAALGRTPMWTDTSLFRKLVFPKTANTPPPRLVRTRSSARKVPRDESTDVKDLGDVFQSLAI